jgi:hypothetical protein
MPKVNKKVEMISVLALNVIINGDDKHQPGETFSIDKETGEWLIGVNSAKRVKDGDSEVIEDK